MHVNVCIYIYIHMHVNVYIYIYMYVCVCWSMHMMLYWLQLYTANDDSSWIWPTDMNNSGNRQVIPTYSGSEALSLTLRVDAFELMPSNIIRWLWAVVTHIGRILQASSHCVRAFGSPRGINRSNTQARVSSGVVLILGWRDQKLLLLPTDSWEQHQESLLLTKVSLIHP